MDNTGKAIINDSWKVHASQLLDEIAKNDDMAVLIAPLNIFKGLLRQVAERAIQINDKELNKLMIRLALYEQADPLSEEYNEKMVNEYLES